jgi:hypothetical protein
VSAPHAATENLPLFDWAEERYLLTKEGKRLPRWGSVERACAILDGCRRQELYDLIAARLVDAYKLKPHRANSHWRVDLLSVWKHKQGQMKTAPAKAK